MTYKNVVLIFAALLAGLGSLNAQGQQLNMQSQGSNVEVSDAELERYVKAIQDVQAVNREMQMKVQKLIKDEGMEVNRYQEIVKAQRSGNSDMSEEEQKKFDNLQGKIKEEQEGMRQKYRSILQDHNFENKRFTRISQAMRSDKELQKRFREMQQK